MKGILESEKSFTDDYLNHIDMINKKFGGEKVPQYMMGFSLGALFATRLSLLKPNFFKSLALISPSFKLLNDAEF